MLALLGVRHARIPLQLIQRLAGPMDADGAVRLRPIALGALIEHAYHVPASPNKFENSA